MIKPNHKSFLTGLFAYGTSEIVAKLSRFLVVVAIARVLSPVPLA